MARNEEPRAGESLMLFQVDPSWYERYWWQDSAPRKPGIFAFFRRILSQQRLTRRQDVRTDHEIPHAQKMPDRNDVSQAARADGQATIQLMGPRKSILPISTPLWRRIA